MGCRGEIKIGVVLTLAAASLSLSCERETAPKESAQCREVVLNLSGMEVRTTLNASRDRMLWQDGDTIAVYNDYDESVAYATYKASDVLKVDVPSAATALTAVYPYNAPSSPEPSLFQRQSKAGVLNGRYCPIVAQAPIISSSANLRFSTVGCTLALNIYNPLAAGEKLFSVRIKPSQLENSYQTTLDTLCLLDTVAPESKRLYKNQVYVCLPKGNYSSVEFEVVTSAGSYTVTTNEIVIDCQNYDFRVFNLNLSKYTVSLLIPSDSESYEDSAEECDVTSSLQSPTFDAADAPYADAESPYDLDFSSAGYHYGEASWPVRSVGKTVTISDYELANAASPIDTTTFLSNAISSTPKGQALLIGPGDWNISSTLYVTRGDITVRGVMTSQGDTTRICARGTTDYTAMIVGKSLDRGMTLGAMASITDTHAPAGSWYVNVDNPEPFSKGCRVTVFRPATTGWINAIRMGEDIVDPQGHNWLEDLRSHDIAFERKIRAVSGSRVYFDAPLPMDIDACWGGADMVLSNPSRISEVGIEDILFDSYYDSSVLCTPDSHDPDVPQNTGQYETYGPYPCDESHAASAIVVKAAEHCWIKGISVRHFSASAVGLAMGARNVNVENCTSRCPVSLITGSRRYAFRIADGAELCLVKDCECWEDRHAFVTPNICSGPNVFLRCTAHRTHSNLGPHAYWATYILYDNVRSVDNYYASFSGKTIKTVLSVEDTGGEANLTSHGWQGANHVFWNCEADYIQCQSPWATGINWAWGCVGTKRWGNYFNSDPRGLDPETWKKGDTWRPDGNWNPDAIGGEQVSQKMSVESLYEKQLSDRISAGRTLL